VDLLAAEIAGKITVLAGLKKMPESIGIAGMHQGMTTWKT
jgi:hypothetical protein